MLPREKLLQQGIKAVSNDELLAIILGKGSVKETVFSISQRLIESFGNHALKHIQNPLKLSEMYDIPIGKAMQIVACIEIGKRLFSKSEEDNYLSYPEKIAEYVSGMKLLKKEFVRGLYVNIQNKLIHDEVISIGSLSANIVHPREVFFPAIKFHAYGFFLIHNHPSGEYYPSQMDTETTQELFKLSKMLQIEFLDHIIVAKKGWFSFRENGFFKPIQP